MAAAFASSEEVATLSSAGAVERRDAATLARRGATAALKTSGELRCGALRVAGELVKACGGDAFGRIIVDGVGRDEAHGGVITSVAWAGDDVLSTSDDRRVTRWRINGDALEKVWTGGGTRRAAGAPSPSTRTSSPARRTARPSCGARATARASRRCAATRASTCGASAVVMDTSRRAATTARRASGRCATPSPRRPRGASERRRRPRRRPSAF